MFSGLRRCGGGIPTEGAGCARGRGFTAGEEADGFGAEDGAASVKHSVGEACEIFGGRKQTGVGGDAAEDVGVFVLDFALDDSVAEGAVVGRGWNLSARFFGRVECGVGHG